MGVRIIKTQITGIWDKINGYFSNHQHALGLGPIN